MKLVGISGSLRAASFNTALLRAAAASMPHGSTLEIGTIEGIPLYNADVEEKDGMPPAVTALKDQIAGADGLLLATPEYNNSIPGVFKNAIDWLTRPPEDIARVFRKKPVALIGASPGGFGTILGQNAWLPVMRTVGARLWNERRMMVSRAGDVFDADGAIADEKVTSQLERFLAEFVDFAAEVRGG